MKVKINSKKCVYDGFYHVDLIDFQHELYQGGLSTSIQRELFNRSQGALLFLYDLKNKLVVLIEQCRAGALSDPDGKHWLIEPAAGGIEKGETPKETCIREGFEEVGAVLSIEDLEFIAQYYPSPGGSGEIHHLYAAEIDASTLPDYAGLIEECEDIKILKIPFEEAYKKLQNKNYRAASTIIALQWLFLNKVK